MTKYMFIKYSITNVIAMYNKVTLELSFLQQTVKIIFI